MILFTDFNLQIYIFPTYFHSPITPYVIYQVHWQICTIPLTSKIIIIACNYILRSIHNTIYIYKHPWSKVSSSSIMIIIVTRRTSAIGSALSCFNMRTINLLKDNNMIITDKPAIKVISFKQKLVWSGHSCPTIVIWCMNSWRLLVHVCFTNHTFGNLVYRFAWNFIVFLM